MPDTEIEEQLAIASEFVRLNPGRDVHAYVRGLIDEEKSGFHALSEAGEPFRDGLPPAAKPTSPPSPAANPRAAEAEAQARDYVNENFKTNDWLAVLAINRKSGETVQRVSPAKSIVSPEYQRWLRYLNATGSDVYVSLNTFKERARGRTKEDLREIRHLYLDLDEGGAQKLEAIRQDNAIPVPNYVLNTSPGKFQVIWRVEGIGQDQAETMLRTFAPRLANDAQSFQMGGIWGAPAVWKDASGQTWLYVPIWGPVSKGALKFPITNGPNPHGCIMAFKVQMNPNSHTPTLRPVWVSRDFNLPDSPIVANGLVFALSTGENADQRASDRSRGTRPAVLYALDARTGAVLFDSGGLINSWVHFSGLAIADGKVYVVDHDSWVYCLGLGHGAPSSFTRAPSSSVSGATVVGRSESTESPSLPPPGKRRIAFRRDVAPILRKNCVSCHGPNKQMGGLRLDTRTGALKGGNSGPAIKPGNSAGSRLIWAVSGTHNIPVMPFGGRKLTPEEIAILRAWIDQGALWPASVGRLTPHSTHGN